METLAGKLETWRRGALSRLKQYPYDVTEGFVLIASVTALSSPGASRGRKSKKKKKKKKKNAGKGAKEGGEGWGEAK